MKHGVAVRADGPKILRRPHLVSCSNFGERNNVMHMNEASTKGSVPLLKPQVTYHARGTEVINARLTCSPIPLVCVHKHLPDGPLPVIASGHLLRAFDQWSVRLIRVKRPLNLDG